ncbi:MAG: class I SAM-dependent methyltransferase [Lachnospiraceae bacterium]
MELSKRLQAVASMVSKGNKVADIGTDHSYIPIYLVEEGSCPSVIAMDINEGPLERAKAHITEHHLGNYIEARRSNGLQALLPGEVETVIVAGMGGALIMDIMETGKAVAKEVREFILQPQSEVEKVRRFLQSNQYQIIEENIIEEDGKYYPMMKVIHGEDTTYDLVEFRYGKCLLESKHPVLLQYLKREERIKQQILDRIASCGNRRTKEREQKVQEELQYIQKALERF